MMDAYMYRDSMEQISNKETSELIKLGKKIGLEKKDMNTMLKNILPRNEQHSFSLGPSMYNGGYYGTISINDFEKQFERNP